MNTTRWWRVLMIPALTAALAACGNQGGPAADSGGTPAAGDPGQPPADSSLVPMIASGTVRAPATTAASAATPAAKTTPEGRRRTVLLAEAVKAVPFTLLEPTDLPKGADRGSAVHLIEPYEGQAADHLPAVRMIYDLEGGGSLILLQSPARGLTSDTREITEINGHRVYIHRKPGQFIINWEQDGVQLELRATGIRREALDRIIESMAPLGSKPVTSSDDAAGGTDGTAAAPAGGAATATGATTP